MKQERLTVYAYDLLWLAAKPNYDKFDLPLPSEAMRDEKKDTRTAEEIKNDLLKKFTE